MENTHNFSLPKTNLIGVGSIKDLPNELLSWKLSKALIVTDKNMISLGYVEMIETILKNLFIAYDVFDGVLHPNPTVSYVQDGLSYFPQGLELRREYKLIISIGGGTNHDCAKGIAAVAVNGGSITDYEGYNKISKPGIPHIAINTSYSAAEMTMFAIITDESRKVKMTIASPNIIPFISVNDPLFMSTMPKEITASSGIDIISHASEAYMATEASPITDSLALGAMKLAAAYLGRAYENGNDLEAREKLMYANVMAGMAFNNAGLGYIHALAHQLGGFYNHIHGTYNGILLPHVIAFNAPALPEEKVSKMAEALGEKAYSKAKGVEKIVSCLKKLCADLELPDGLRRIGVQETDIDALSHNALKDIASFTNPRRGDLEDIRQLYKGAM